MTDLATIIQQAAVRHGLDPQQFTAQMRQESGLDPNIVSKAGAIGIGQLMPATARGLGVANPRDPAQNVEGAATYMQRLTQQFGGDRAQALAAYNWGPGNVMKAHGDLSSAPAETRAYVAKLTGPAGAGGSPGPSSAAPASLPVPPVPPEPPATLDAPPAPAVPSAPGPPAQPADPSPLATLLAQSAAAVRGQGSAQTKPGQPPNSVVDSLKGLA